MEYVYGKYGVQMYGGFLVEDGVEADFPLVGSRRTVTNDFCGTFSRNMGCLESYLHAGKSMPVGVLGQKSFDDKIHGRMALVYVHAFRCTDPLCPECCLHWAKLQYARAKRRFDAFDKEYIDKGYEKRHITVSIPRFDYDKGLKFMRRQISAFAESVGVVGFMCMYHPKRYSHRLKCWYFSPHFHLYGYVLGGRVDGVLVRDLHNLSGYVLKNLGRRKSEYGTIMYQLSHAGVPDGRQHAVTWHGALNYRMGKSVPVEVYDILFGERKPECCPVCGNSLYRVCRVVGAPHFNYEGFEDRFVLDDVENWCIVEFPKRRRKVFDDLDSG